MAKLKRSLRPLDKVKAIEDSARLGPEEEFIGGSIRELRLARDITLSQLAEMTGLSVSFISKIERNQASPSIRALFDISRALGVTISWFFRARDGVSETERDYIVRAERRRKLVFESGISDELLSPNLSGELELLMSRFPPLSESGVEPYAHKGEEAGVIIKGELELWIGGERFLLKEGDSFSFPSTEPHRYRNPSDEESIVIWAITPPTY